jgi:hypothetical protein
MMTGDPFIGTRPQAGGFHRFPGAPGAGTVVFKRTGTFPGEAAETDVFAGKKQEQEREKAYICRFCGRVIALPADTIAVDGSHRHTFTNPAGVIYEIGCFSSARGCRVTGGPTLEFTWFSGYSWSFALCSGCGNHMGWYYQKEGSGFYGLVAAYLAENW